MDLTQLIEEYLGLRDRGVDVDVEELVARAGERGDELREQLAVFARLEELAGSLEDHAPDEDTPERIGRFRVVRSLGRGGLSQVFLAEDENLGRTVALKVLHPSTLLGVDSAGLSAVSREGRSLAKLRHPGIVAVHEIDAVEGRAYVAMEYVDGPTLFQVLCALRELAGREEPLDLPPGAYAAAHALESVGARCLLVASIARALHACHTAGIVHRDVKPGNILLDPEHAPKLVDFGLAHLDTGEGALGHTEALVGTAAYVAPEQVDQERTGASPASDQFSLGVVLYELLTLENPFARPTRSATMTAISAAEPRQPRKLDTTIHADVERICTHCLERRPEDRYPDLAALAGDLEAFAAHRPISLRAPSPWRRAQLWLRRNRRALARATAVVAATIVVGLGLSAWSLHRERSELQLTIRRTRAAVESCTDVQTLAGLYHDADRLRTRNHELDAPTLARVLPPLDPDGRALIDGCSRRLHELLTEELQARTRPEADTILRYRTVLDLDRQYCPECPYNADDRDRGYLTVAAPLADERATVSRVGNGSSLTPVDLEPERLVSLPPGVYHLVYRSETGSVRERVFEALPTARPRRIDAIPLSAELRRDMIEVEGRGNRPGFLVGRSLVTWRQYRQVMPEEFARQMRTIRHLDPGEELDSAAIVPWHRGLEYASRLGARYCTLEERERAEAAGLATGSLPTEWTATPYEEYRTYFPSDGRTGMRRDGLSENTGFRLAVSLPAEP